GRPCARESKTESAAPHAARANEDDLGLRHSPQDVGRSAGAAQPLNAVVLDVASRPKDDVFTLPQSADYFGDDLFRPLSRFTAGALEVRYPYGPQQGRERVEQRVTEVFVVEHRSGTKPGPQD